MPEESFDQGRYWVERHEKFQGDPRSVGTFAASVEDNLKGERDYQAVVSLLAGLVRPKVTNSVLDFGCGYGRVATQWIDGGFAYTGIDISQVAIDDARNRDGRGAYVCANLLDYNPATRAFGVVTCFYVLVHFVDDAEWGQVLDRALSAVENTGVFVFADYFPKEQEHVVVHAKAKPIDEYERQLNIRGFELDASLRAGLLEVARNPTAQHFYFARRQKV